MKTITQRVIQIYLQEINKVDDQLQNSLIKSLTENWSKEKTSAESLKLGSIIRKFDERFSEYESVELRMLRINTLNNMYINSVQYMWRRENQIPISPTEIPSRVFEVDQLLTVKYRDGSRHYFTDLLSGAAETTFNSEVQKDLLDRAYKKGLTFGIVSSESTKCYICIPWLGKVGSIGMDIPGYIRLDGVFPIHWKCIHRVLPIANKDVAKYENPPDWVVGATRKDYYAKMAETDEGRRTLYEYRQQEGMNTKGKRLKRMAGKLRIKQTFGILE